MVGLGTLQLLRYLALRVI